MRRGLPMLVLALVAASVPAAPVSGAEEDLRWIAYVRGDPDQLQGGLETVRSDGRRERTLAEDGVTSVDLGPSGSLYAIRETGEGFSLVRGHARRGRLTPVEAGPADSFLLGLAAAPDDGVAVGRFIPVEPEVPEHLDGEIEPLSRTNVPVLAPPSRPPGTTGTVTDVTRRFYNLLFTNDPEDRLAHAEQVNRFVTGSVEPRPGPSEATSVPVRGTDGSFSCGASACFLQWEEFGMSYSVGEFGTPEDAASFAESLVLLDDLLGPGWRFQQGFQIPQVVTVGESGEATVLDEVEEFCECGFRPVDWAEGRVLVVFGAESLTALHEYPAGGGEPTILEEGTDDLILDAAYGPDGLLLLTTGEGGPPGQIRGPDGEVVVEGARAFDVAGTTLAYVREDGAVVVRDLESGNEKEVGSGAIDVSVGPDLVARGASPSPVTIPGRPDGGFPTLLVALVAGGAAAVLLGGVLLAMGIRRRRVRSGRSGRRSA